MKRVYRLMFALSCFCALSATINDDLIQAAIAGKLAAVQLLIHQKADIHTGNDFALRIAAEKGHCDIVELLLHNHANIHASNDYALRWAAEMGRFAVTELLLNNGANVHADEEYALKNAATNGHFALAALLLRYGSHIQSYHTWNSAHLNHHYEIVSLLKLCSNKAFEPFRKNTEEFIKHEHTIHPNQLILWAIALNKPEIVAMLLEKYPMAANAAYITEDAGIMTALMFAASFGFDDIAHKLLFAGANINVQNKEGKNALKLAADYGQYQTATKLLAWQQEVSIF